MKLFSWNVNGIRSVQRKGFLEWFEAQKPDIVCVQETKAQPHQLSEELLNPLGYHASWFSAEKKGYSGVATFSRREPLSVRKGMGNRLADREGRVLISEFPELTLINAYFPNSQREHTRLDFKLSFCHSMMRLMNKMRREGRHVALCGDFNIAHREIDLTNSKQNRNSAGFLPQERAWMDRLLKNGYVDSFRHFCDEPGHYTWWSQRLGVRERNIGWRLDYFATNPELVDRYRAARIQPQVKGSDHCPVVLELKP
ncbi:MAG: exodeoxyribonuclease III [bacterium]|nr:exodeoxyribonuclease III [bacterium]